MSHKQVLNSKNISACIKCRNFRHCSNDHQPDGSFSPRIRSSPESNTFNTSCNAASTNTDDHSKKKSKAHNTITLNNSIAFDQSVVDGNNGSVHIGRLVENGAPYSAIGPV